MPILESIDVALEVVSTPLKTEEISEMLGRALRFPNINAVEAIESKIHFKYLLNYLFHDPDGLNVKTIVIEKNYTSESYLDDYYNYYSKCYFPYPKQCRRIHLFSECFSKAEFLEMLTIDKHREIWNTYQGHIVIKPLPKGIIGASLIAQYKRKNHRFYTAIREYQVTLFGKKLKISAMPYQEQDSIVGSCASASLWFAFHITSKLFRTPTPSPSIITLSAGTDSNYTGKSFPSNSLETTQICKAISANGLISEVRDSSSSLTDDRWLKSFIYSYSRMGIPVLLGIDLEGDGSHLITVNGYRFDHDKNQIPLKNVNSQLNGIRMASDEIIKFYAHDDQCGPYSKLEFTHNEDFHLQTSLWENISSDKTLRASASIVIVPLHENIKVTFENILEEVSVINFDIKKRVEIEFTWDIFLMRSNKYKKIIRDKIIKNPESYDYRGFSLQLKTLPKYVWVVQAKLPDDEEDFLIFDILYDAIDVNYLNNPYTINIYNEDFRAKAQSSELFSLNVFENDERSGAGSYSDFALSLNENSKLINIIETVESEEWTGKKDKFLSLYQNMNEDEKNEFEDFVKKYLRNINDSLNRKKE